MGEDFQVSGRAQAPAFSLLPVDDPLRVMKRAIILLKLFSFCDQFALFTAAT